MAVSEADLSTILRHCRSLLDAADQLDSVRAGRAVEASQALAEWRGEHSETFRLRLDSEADDLLSVARGFRVEADRWAGVWADTVNQVNQQRRADRVEQVSAARSFGEKAYDFIDIFHGDDSGDQVRAYTPVAVPTAATRYTPTGGLETF